MNYPGTLRITSVHRKDGCSILTFCVDDNNNGPDPYESVRIEHDDPTKHSNLEATSESELEDIVLAIREIAEKRLLRVNMTELT